MSGERYDSKGKNVSDDTIKTHILLTKLQRSPVASDILPRVQLLDRLNELRHRTLKLISAPAGYGKTTLAVQWLERCPNKVAWISLDPDRFSRCLAASMQIALSGCSPHDLLPACRIIRGTKR